MTAEPAPQVLDPAQVAHLAGKYKAALWEWMRDIDVQHGGRTSILTFQHPVNGAAVMVTIDGGDADQARADGALPATVGIFIVLGDFAPIAGDPSALVAMFGLNAHLMASAVGVLPLNEDEVVLALCRRLPVDSLPADEVRNLIDGIIWEYAANTGFLREAPEPTPPGPAAGGGRIRLS